MGSGAVKTTQPYGVLVGDAYLVLPDRTKATSNTLTSGMLGVWPDRPVSEVAVCMSVPAPVSGQYEFVVTANGVKPKPKGLKFGL